MKSAITICLVPEARGGPFVFHEGLAAGCRHAAELGFNAVEVFPESSSAVPRDELRGLLSQHNLQLAAIGTGGGWVKHQLHLCHADAQVRQQARQFIRSLIEVAGEFAAPAIIGSMQGRVESGVSRDQALAWLAEALQEFETLAARYQQVLLFEPLNRYETNLFNRQRDAADFLRQSSTRHVRLLCDLFHMNIEEADLAGTLRDVGDLIGHIHWADSNRRAMGWGHTRAEPIVAALAAIGYEGYLSAEIFPLPDAISAARQSIESIHRFTP